MHEVLCRPSDTTLDILHVERRAADHSANMGSSGLIGGQPAAPISHGCRSPPAARAERETGPRRKHGGELLEELNRCPSSPFCCDDSLSGFALIALNLPPIYCPDV